MSGDSYFRHKVIMEIGTFKKKDKDKNKQENTFQDDHELLDYLLEQEQCDLSLPGSNRKDRLED